MVDKAIVSQIRYNWESKCLLTGGAYVIRPKSVFPSVPYYTRRQLSLVERLHVVRDVGVGPLSRLHVGQRFGEAAPDHLGVEAHHLRAKVQSMEQHRDIDRSTEQSDK